MGVGVGDGDGWEMGVGHCEMAQTAGVVLPFF